MLKNLLEKLTVLRLAFDKRRKHFFINKPLQLRFMAYVCLPIIIITIVIMVSLYVGIWGSVLDAFSEAKFRQSLLTSSAGTYQQAAKKPNSKPFLALTLFKQSEKLSRNQREMFREILNETNAKIIPYFFFLVILIAWGSIYISHKIAGPLYRFHKILEEIETNNLTARVNLRKTDEGQALAKRFNFTMMHLDATLSKLKNIVKENEGDPERLKNRIKDELSRIRTSSDS